MTSRSATKAHLEFALGRNSVCVRKMQPCAAEVKCWAVGLFGLNGTCSCFRLLVIQPGRILPCSVSTACCEMGILAGARGCVCWVSDLVLPLPCLVWGRLKLVWVVSSFVPSPGHAGSEHCWFKRFESKCPGGWGGWQRAGCPMGWGVRTALHSSVPAPARNLLSSHWIPALGSVVLGRKNPLLTTLWVTRRVVFPGGSLSPGSEDSQDVSWQKFQHCAPSRLAAPSPPKASGCLTNTLLCPVSCRIFPVPVGVACKGGKISSPQTSASLFLSLWFTLSTRISLHHFIIIFDTKSNVFKMFGQPL